LDRTLFHFSQQIGAGKWTAQGLPEIIASEEHLAVGFLRGVKPFFYFISRLSEQFWRLKYFLKFAYMNFSK
jgi:hypothetical protein